MPIDRIATATSAVGLAWTAIIVPFVFVFEPAILLSGPLGEIAIDILRLLAGVWLVSGSIVGQLLGPLKGIKRAAFALAGLLALLPEPALPSAEVTLWATFALAVLCIAVDAFASHRTAEAR